MHFLVARNFKYICFCITFIFIFVASLMLYICSNQMCNFYQLEFLNSPYYAVHWHKLKAKRQLLSNKTFQNSLNSEYESQAIIMAKSDFNIKGSDVIVFLHIQNTGSSVFARHMVEDLKLEKPCRCKKNRRICHCYRPNNYGSTWLFSRYTTGWKCGVHPDWSELSSCVDKVMDEDEGKPVKRRYFFVTILREPVKRFLSEFWHLRRRTLPDEIGTLDNFLNCSSALNRQTRMLADSTLLVHGGNSSSHDDDLILLTSAKNNLHKMSFFGLSEFPKVSQYIFQVTFGLNFRILKKSRNDPGSRSRNRKEMSGKDVERIEHLNHLDRELYYYAKELLFYRFQKLKKLDPLFENYFQKSNMENWADKEDNLLD